MPPLPTIADTYRCTFNWREVNGVKPHNVIHVRGSSTNESDVGDALVAALATHQFEGMSEDFVLESITTLALDGSSSGFDSSGGGYNSGGGTGDWSPASAIVTKFQTNQRGARGRGRIFVGPVQESVIADGRILLANALEIVGAWEDFQTSLHSGSPELEQVVASYTHADAHRVTAYSTSLILGTQRRRQDQLR